MYENKKKSKGKSDYVCERERCRAEDGGESKQK
jgi:hypothetical protein